MGFPVMRKSKMSCITFKNPVKIGVELPPESLLILFSDHGFVENPHFEKSDKYRSSRYLHGEDSPFEIIVPWAILTRI